MHTWTINAFDRTTALSSGSTSSYPQAWADAIDSALRQLAEAPNEGVVIVLEGSAHLLVPARTDGGTVDAAATRAAAERMAAVHLQQHLTHGT